jgi:N-methylhydantoinase A
LSPNLKLGGSVAMHEALASQAVGALAAAISGLDTVGAADGIVRIAVARMVSAIKEISISRGYDPRDFVLLAYGGAGPMHAAQIADELEITKIIVPPRPGNFSAFGALVSDIRHDYVRSERAELGVADLSAILQGFVQLEASARETMVAEGIPGEKITMLRACGMRYAGQSWDLTVRISSSTREALELADLFHRAHEQRYGYRLADRVEIVSLHLSAIGEVIKPKLPEWAVKADSRSARPERRPAYFAGKEMATLIYDRDGLPRGAKIAGPAIVEEMGSVTVVPPGWSIEVEQFGEFHLGRDHP